MEHRRRARRRIAGSDDEEQSVDQPVQKKAVRKLVLDKQKKAAANEIDPAATEEEGSEDDDSEETPFRSLKVPRIPWRVVKEGDNSKFTPGEIQAEQEIIIEKSLAESGFTSDNVEAISDILRKNE